MLLLQLNCNRYYIYSGSYNIKTILAGFYFLEDAGNRKYQIAIPGVPLNVGLIYSECFVSVHSGGKVECSSH
jgi:hypothetical protein